MSCSLHIAPASRFAFFREIPTIDRGVPFASAVHPIRSVDSHSPPCSKHHTDPPRRRRDDARQASSSSR